MPTHLPTTPASSPGSAAPSDVSQVLAEIRRIAAEALEIHRPIEPGDALVRDLELDSMGLIVLAVALEDRFRIKLSEQDSTQVVTVGELAELVLRRAREGASR